MICILFQDSCYFALSTPDLESAIKEHMKERYNKEIYGRCDVEEVLPDFDRVWFPRRCCPKHTTYDSKTPGKLIVKIVLYFRWYKVTLKFFSVK